MLTHLTNSECETLLAANRYGHLGCSDGDEPFVFPITYVYKDGFLYGATQEGTKIEIIRKHPKICIQVEHIQDGLKWESVMCWGMFEEVTDDKSIQDIRLLLAKQYGHAILEEGATPVSPSIEHLHEERSEKINNSVIYRMKPYRMSGRAEQH